MTRITTSILLLLLPFLGLGQKYEIGGQLGLSNYWGDLAPSLAVGETHEQFGFFVRVNRPNGFFAYKYALNYGKISGDDQNFDHNKTRNLNFRSTLIELSAQVEFNFQKYFRGLRAKKFSPYVFAGLGLLYHKPQGELDGEWIDLRPLSTEGQGIDGNSSYSSLVPVIPFGGGVKWRIAKRWNFTGQVGFRYTFSDYLDDVSGEYFDSDKLLAQKGELATLMANKSLNPTIYEERQRGNPDQKDWYMFAQVSLSYWLLDKHCFNFK